MPRIIPSIEQLRQRRAVRALEQQYGRDALVSALRQEAAALRERLRDDAPEAGAGAIGTSVEAAAHLERAAERRLRAEQASSLRLVLNATGVVLHTNLGRAPLAGAAAASVARLAAAYVNLEYDVAEGRRGRRDLHAEALLCRLTGAEAAVVVNNNAAAALLVLSALAAGREVLISRGELVEIGGGFRVPDVMKQSGALLREVGTTNRTRTADYAAAIGAGTALILRVHPSNFRIEGFAGRPALEELVALGGRFDVPVVEDLGSGRLQGRDPGSGIRDPIDDPLVQDSVAAGAGLVFFSGDKLLGGPQAGLIVGRRALVQQVRQHPLMRALRVDKMTYAALEATLQEHAAGRAADTVPAARMLALAPEAIERRALAAIERLRDRPHLRARIIDGLSTPGGGSAPGAGLPTRLLALALDGLSAAALEARLRALDPPIVARIESDEVVLDLRTILPEQDDLLVRGLRCLGE